ncbi:Peptide methionine sulfoxide reductase MsrB [Seminavis robusta]|uniref:Peptide methionine sulfoxide reductase MsrB n=1 Tax=Seminavis robusta TaxID=568900 RepID=A0A9N8HYF3_9STRA|nr:Peptide methionine sulfoxide reductase MsrB [Seminavis robusta]|eukprot:Sro2868_g339020.1 Peptide methionine sulfoxide reductase MsrB (234) ;mRNA; f:716-1417
MQCFLTSFILVATTYSYITSALAAPAGLERRRMLHTTITTLATAASTKIDPAHAADANNIKSRTDGYTVQRTEREWAYVLSGAQYNILRRGGTERQKSSILNTFTAANNSGTYSCAGCNTALFASNDKFNSNTGWPSFASALPGVEVEELDPVRATLNGREVRCGTCGGHLGDLFNDGWVYVGTSAAKTGQRYCIDGAALIFKPQDGGPEVFGDQPPPSKVINYEPSMYREAR